MNRLHFPRVGSIAKRDLLLVDAELPVKVAAQLMHERGVTSVVYSVLGTYHVFSIEHVLSIAHTGTGYEDTPMANSPVQAASTIAEDARVPEALERMNADGTRYLVVLSECDLAVGILTYTDILNAIDPSLLVDKKTIGEIVKRREVVTFSPDWIFEDVLCHLTHIEDCIIVVDGEQIVGIVTCKDAFRAIIAGESTNRPLSVFLKAPVITVSSTASIQEAIGILSLNRIKRVVVVDGYGHLAGVVSQSELVGLAYGYWTRLLHHHSDEIRELVDLLDERRERQAAYWSRDTLSGLGTRRRLAERMGAEIERVRRYNVTPFSVLMLEVQGFREQREKCGLVVANRIIHLMGKVIASSIRSGDEAFRLEDARFLVLVAHSNASGAASLALRIRAGAVEVGTAEGAPMIVLSGISQFVTTETAYDCLQRAESELATALTDAANGIVIAEISPTTKDNSPGYPDSGARQSS